MNRQDDRLLGCQSGDCPSIRLTSEDLILAHSDCSPCLRRNLSRRQAFWLGVTPLQFGWERSACPFWTSGSSWIGAASVPWHDAATASH